MNTTFDDDNDDEEPDDSTPKEVQRRNHPSVSGREKVSPLNPIQFYQQNLHFTKVRELAHDDGKRVRREYAIHDDPLDNPSVWTTVGPMFPGSNDWAVHVFNDGPVKTPFMGVSTRKRAEMVERGMVSRLAGPTGDVTKSAVRQYNDVQKGLADLENEANKEK